MIKWLKIMCLGCLFYTLVSCSNNNEANTFSAQPTKEELIERIATNLQSMAMINLGAFQLMQIKKSIEDLNYSYEELQFLDVTVTDRVASQKIYKEYSEGMNIHLIKAMQEEVSQARTLTDYTIY